MARPEAVPTASATSRQTAACARVNRYRLEYQKKRSAPGWGTDRPFRAPAQNEVNWEGN